MKGRISSLLAAATFMWLGACMPTTEREPAGQNPNEPIWPDPGTDPFMVIDFGVSHGHLSGNFGGVLLDQEANTFDAYGDSEWTSISMRADTEAGPWGLLWLEAFVSLDHPVFQPGSVSTFEWGYSDEFPDLYLDLIGCSGQTSAGMDWDVPADRVTVTASADPGDANGVILDFRAVFDAYAGYPQVVTGSMTIARN